MAKEAYCVGVMTLPARSIDPTWPPLHTGDIVAVDMFVVATATFRLLYALVVLGHNRRRVIHFDVTQIPHKTGFSAR